MTEPDHNPRDQRKRASDGHSLWYYVRLTLSVVLFGFVLLVGVAVIVVPAATGSVPMTVLTSSMEPRYPPGTLIIVRPVDPDELAIGDVATYQIRSGEPEVITHRIIGIALTAGGERSFTFQGDNNNAADPDPVQPVQIQGELWYSVPLLGWVNTAVNGKDRSWIVAVIAGALFAYALWMVISGIRDRRRKSRAAAGGRGRRSARVPTEPAAAPPAGSSASPSPDADA